MLLLTFLLCFSTASAAVAMPPLPPPSSPPSTQASKQAETRPALQHPFASVSEEWIIDPDDAEVHGGEAAVRDYFDAADFVEVDEPMTGRQAFTVLLRTNAFRGGAIGVGGSPSKQYLAYRLLREHEDADVVFADILHRGAVGGKLFAVLYLQETDPAAAVEAAEVIDRSAEVDYGLIGCVSFSRTAGEILGRPDDGAAETILSGGLAEHFE